MNIAVVLAGGSGSRMGMVDRPKQFIDIYGKPVIIHTLEAFEINEKIDAICVVCVKAWQAEQAENYDMEFSHTILRFCEDIWQAQQPEITM